MNETNTTVTVTVTVTETATDDLCFDLFGSTRTPAEELAHQVEQNKLAKAFRTASKRSLRNGQHRGALVK